MFNNVLLTIDLQAEASWKKALPQAIEIVRASGGQLHIMSVIPVIGSAMVEGYLPPGFDERALETARESLEALVEAQVPDEINVKQHLARGKVHKQVLKAIEKIGCDLVVMASHKPDRVREILVGSNADKVVRRSHVSVLIVRG